MDAAGAQSMRTNTRSRVTAIPVARYTLLVSSLRSCKEGTLPHNLVAGACTYTWYDETCE